MTPREELRQIIKATSSALPIPAQAAVGMVWKRLDAALAELDERISMLERGDNGDRN